MASVIKSQSDDSSVGGALLHCKNEYLSRISTFMSARWAPAAEYLHDFLVETRAKICQSLYYTWKKVISFIKLYLVLSIN